MTAGQIEATVQLGQSAFENKQWAQAVHHWAIVLKAHPNNASLLHGLGLASFNLGQREDGLAYVRRSTTADGARPEFLGTLARMLTACGQGLEARAAVEDALRGAREDWKQRLFYLDILLETGTAADVRVQLFTCHHLIARLSGDQRDAALAVLFENLSKAFNTYALQGRLEDAEHVLELGIRLFPNATKVAEANVELLHRMGDWKRCASAAKALGVARFKKPEALIAAASASAWVGNFADALAFMWPAWSLNPVLAMTSRRHYRPEELQAALNGRAAARRLLASQILVSIVLAFAIMLAFVPGVARGAGFWLTLLTLAFLLIAAEFAVRIKLWRRNHVPGELLILPVLAKEVDHPMVDIVGHAGVVYDAKSGFNYFPGAAFARGYFENGRITTFNTISVDQHGNCGDSARDYESASFRTLAFGDSFTCSTGSQTGLHWPHFFANACQEKLGRSVAAVNFGRGFYGVLQMVSLAADVVAKWKPDLIVIAYITRDLARPRSWAHRAFVGGRERFLRTFKPGEPIDLANAFDATIVEPAVTAEWFAERAAKGDQDDLLKETLRRHLQCRARGDHRCLGLFDFKTSVLLNTLFYGDPLERAGMASPRERWMIKDGNAFEADAALHADAAVLKASGVKLALVHIPARDEIVAGKEFAAKDVDLELKRGLERALGVGTIDLLPYILNQKFDIKDFCINDEDDHPTALGERIYGSAIATALMERGLVQ